MITRKHILFAGIVFAIFVIYHQSEVFSSSGCSHPLSLFCVPESPVDNSSEANSHGRPEASSHGTLPPTPPSSLPPSPAPPPSRCTEWKDFKDDVKAGEKWALETLHHCLQQWPARFQWDEPSYCKWLGVKCSEEGYVEIIYTGGLGLSGFSLEDLDFEGLELWGLLPPRP